MAFNRELSQFANYLELDASANYIGIAAGKSAGVGIGSANPTSKLTVTGDANVSGVVTATTFLGNVTGDVTGDLTGNADTATQLATARDLSLTGDGTATLSGFDGTANVSGALTLATVNSNTGSFGSSSAIPVVTVNAKGLVTAVSTAAVGSAMTVTADTGSEDINFLTESFGITGNGENIITTASSNTVDIALNNNVAITDLSASGVVTATSFKTGATGSAIQINTATITGPSSITVDPAGVGDNTGTVHILGNLQVEGTTTTIDSTTVNIADKNIQIATGAANDAAANGGGITVDSGDGDKTFQFEATGDNWGASENLNLASGKTYKINNTSVLSATTLGSAVVSSSLTSVGTLGSLNVAGATTLAHAAVSGVTTSTGGFVGGLTGNVTGNADTATAWATGRDLSLTGDGTATFSGVDGSQNESAALTLATVNSDVGSFGSASVIPIVTVNAKGLVTGISSAAVGTTLTVTSDSGSEDINLLTEELAITGANGEINGTASSNGVDLALATTGVSAATYGSTTAIPVLTVDTKGRITSATTASVGTALTVTGDSGSEDINLLSEELSIAGGTNITSVAASNGVTLNLNDYVSSTGFTASGVSTATSFATGASGSAIIVTSTSITGPSSITIDPAGVGDNSGTVHIYGNLQVEGTTTTIDSTTVNIADKNIQVGTGAANDAAANGAGFTIDSGDGDKTFQFEATGDNFGSSENLNLANGKTYKINNTDVLSATTLGSAVVNSSLTSVGTLTGLTVSGASALQGGITGDLTGNVVGVVTATSLEVEGAFYDINDGAGTSGQILTTVGTGVSWKNIADTLPQTRTTGSATATAGQTTFSFTYNVNYLDVFLNGVKLASSEYTASNGTSIVLSEAAFLGDILEFHSYNTAGTGSGTVSSANDLTDVTLSSPSNGEVLVYSGGTNFVNTTSLTGLSAVTASGQIQAATFNGTTSGTFASAAVSDLTSGRVVLAGTSGEIEDSGNLTFNGSTLTVTGTCAATDFNTTSDITLKENVSIIDGALDMINNLNGINWNWKSDGRKSMGVSAQDVEAVAPELVSTGEHKSVNYNGLIGILIEAVKDQSQQIEVLRTELAKKANKRTRKSS